MISLHHEFLFIHIPKTAGNSIQNILKKYSEERVVSLAPYQDGVERFEVRSDSYTIHKHSTLSEYQAQLGKEVIDGLFKFTCVRNSWERMISFYFSPHRGPVSWNRNEFIRLVNSVAPVTDFVTLPKEKEANPNEFDNIDTYMRYENLNRDFRKVCKRIGIPPLELPRRNVSNHQHYSTYYDQDLVNLVKDRFQNEIRFFNFEFEGRNKDSC